MLQGCGFAGNRLKAGPSSELARAGALAEAIQLRKFRRQSFDLKGFPILGRCTGCINDN